MLVECAGKVAKEIDKCKNNGRNRVKVLFRNQYNLENEGVQWMGCVP